jgi:hypothetical protein
MYLIRRTYCYLIAVDEGVFRFNNYIELKSRGVVSIATKVPEETIS